MRDPVILEAVRTPIGKREGSLSGVRADALLAITFDGLLKKTGLPAQKVEDVIAGCVTQVGEQGANIARQAALLSGLPQTAAGVTLNRMCGSSQQAIHFGSQAVAAGDLDYVIACGVESMSRVPMFSDIQGGFEKLNPALLSKYSLIHQGESAERIAEKYGLSRTELDTYSMESHKRAAQAIKAGFFDSQLLTIEGKNKEGATASIRYDEGVRFELDPQKMGKLLPVFRQDGVITAANSSQISDGAAAVLIADKETAIRDGFKPRARFLARVVAGGDPTLQLLEVIPATLKALKRARLSLSDIDVIEINEAFASVVRAWEKELGADSSKVNPNGGAIAHGHPLGATGAVLMTKLLHELERQNKHLGLQVMCIGHGMATATIIERLS